jgi:hypothetical protein
MGFILFCQRSGVGTKTTTYRFARDGWQPVTAERQGIPATAALRGRDIEPKDSQLFIWPRGKSWHGDGL